MSNAIYNTNGLKIVYRYIMFCFNEDGSREICDILELSSKMTLIELLERIKLVNGNEKTEVKLERFTSTRKWFKSVGVFENGINLNLI